MQYSSQPITQFRFFNTAQGSNEMGVDLFHYLGFSMSTQRQSEVLAFTIEEDSKRWHSLFSPRLTEIDGSTHQTRLGPHAASVVHRSLAISDGLSQEPRYQETQGIIETTDSSARSQGLFNCAQTLELSTKPSSQKSIPYQQWTK